MLDRRAFKVALMLLGIFVAGGFCGWWIARSNFAEEAPAAPASRRSWAEQKEFMLDQFTKELSLTPQQRTNVDQVLELWMQDVRRVERERREARHATFQKFAPLVRTNLTAGQQKIYDRRTEQMERRWRRFLQSDP